jgi:hypothetical protein
MGVLGWALFGALLGAIVAYLGGEAYGALAKVSNFEGGFGMALIFVIVPAGTVLGALIFTIYGIVRWRRNRAAARG